MASKLENRSNTIIERLISIWSRGTRLLYTILMRSRFMEFGQNSRISSPFRVSCPWAIKIGDRVKIDEYAWFNVKNNRDDGRPSLIIGDNTYIGRFSHINASFDVVIENNVLITHRVLSTDEDHNYGDRDTPIIHQGGSFGGSVLLRSGCWIGTGASILPGVTIGKNAIVGTNAVVTQDVPDFTKVGGIPAKVIKQI